jgi:hypothetical protein
MGSDSSISKNKQLDPEQARDREVYRYLLTLTDLGLSPKSATPNETSIANQWGVQNNRIFIRRVLRSVLYEEYYQNKPKEKELLSVPGLTLFKLVSILSSLQEHQRDQQRLLGSEPQPTSVITRAEILNALRIFSRLSSAERERLGIKVLPGEVMLQQVLEKATDPASKYNHAQASQLHNFFSKQLAEQSSISLEERLNSLGTRTARDYILQLVSKHTEQYFPGLERKDKDSVDNEFANKVEREINRINLQSGIEQADSALESDSDRGTQRLYRYLTDGFVQCLVRSVIDNEIITDELPIHIKFIEIKRVRPLPLYLRRTDEETFALNSSLLIAENNAEAENVEGLERQVAYRIQVHFYIKLPLEYEPKFKDLTITNKFADHKRLEFSEEVVGIGCPATHITTVINRVILWDIPALKEFMPIVDEIQCNNEFMGESPNSPVRSSCTARIYERNDVINAINSDEHRDDIATTAEIASADFCGFDLIETAAKAALLVRLKLVKKILSKRPEISTEAYIEELCHRVEEATAFKQARKCLTNYPFSLRAMEGRMDKTIFNNRYRKKDPGFTFEAVDTKQNQEWSTAALQAQMVIAEAYLREGLSHIARRYLEFIRPYFEGEDKYQVSSSLRAKYCICWFRYFYLGDLEHQKGEFPDRYFAVSQAEEELEKAESHLKERLKRYEKLDELPQINVHPHFYFLSCIHAHRAKLYIFFPRYMRKLSQAEMLIEPVRLLEKARIYAARDGDPALYARWSAYQSWCYIMLAYLNKEDGIDSEDFSDEKCFIWAEQLTKHAEICYSSTGKVFYQQIKDNGGKTTKDYENRSLPDPKVPAPSDSSGLSAARPYYRYYEKYGSTLIEVVPLIKELYYDDGEDSGTEEKEKQGYDWQSNVITLDLSLLRKRRKDEESSIYLFGMSSAILLFSQGILSLCKRYDSEGDLVDAIERKSLRMFNYCCAIASDGTTVREDSQSLAKEDPDKIVLDRLIPSVNDSQMDNSQGPVYEGKATSNREGDILLQSLYPHRLTQFADLGNIFIIACELVLLVTSQPFRSFYESTETWEAIGGEPKVRVARIENILKSLLKNDNFPFQPAKACGQKRYNGHLAEHYVQLKKSTDYYILKLQQKKLPDISGVTIRNIVVTEFFKIIRGETSSVSPD